MTDIEVKPVEPQEAPPALTARSGGLLIGGGVAASVIVHLTLGGVVLLASPRLLATVPQNSIMVDLVTPKEFELASKGEPHAATELGAESKPAVESAPKAETKAETKTEANSEPNTEQKTEPRLPPKPDLRASAQPVPPVQRPPAAVTPPPQPVEQKDQKGDQKTDAQSSQQAAKSEEVPDPERIVEMLHLPVQVGSASMDAPPTESAAKLSADEIAAFKGHLKTCWTPPTGVPDVKKLKVVVRVALGPDGKLMGKPTLLAATLSLNGPALVESAMRALAQCQPYSSLPVEKYKEWKLLDLNFSQDDIADVSASPSDGKAGPKG